MAAVAGQEVTSCQGVSPLLLLFGKGRREARKPLFLLHTTCLHSRMDGSTRPGFLHGDVVTSWWRKDLKAWRTGSSKPPHLRAQQAKMGRGGGKPVGSDLLPQGSRSGLLRTEYSFSGISKRSFHDS